MTLYKWFKIKRTCCTLFASLRYALCSNLISLLRDFIVDHHTFDLLYFLFIYFYLFLLFSQLTDIKGEVDSFLRLLLSMCVDDDSFIAGLVH